MTSIDIRWYAYDTVERWSCPVPHDNLIDKQEAEIQMWILFCQRTILRWSLAVALNNDNRSNDNRSSEIQRRVLEQTNLSEKQSNNILLMQKWLM